MRRVQKIYLFFLVLTACNSFHIVADEYEDDLHIGTNDYSHDLKRFEFDIEVEALKVLNTEFSAYTFAKTLKIDEPLYPAKLTPEQVTLKIEDELQRLIKKKFPQTRYEEIKEEAEKKYTMYQVGSHVSIERQYGGQLLKVSGLLEVVSNDLIKISGMPISTVDIAKDDLARLHWTEHEAAVEKYVRSKTHAFDEKRKEFARSERARIARRLWQEAGYRRLRKSGRWVSVMDVFLHQYKKRRGKRLKLLREEIRKEIYSKNGFIFDEAKGGWIPKAVLVAEAEAEKERNAPLIVKMKKFFKKKAKIADKIMKEPEVNIAAEPALSEDGTPAKIEIEEDLWGDDLFSDDDSSNQPEQKKLPEKSERDRIPPEDDVSDLFDEDDD